MYSLQKKKKKNLIIMKSYVYFCRDNTAIHARNPNLYSLQNLKSFMTICI